MTKCFNFLFCCCCRRCSCWISLSIQIIQIVLSLSNAFYFYFYGAQFTPMLCFIRISFRSIESTAQAAKGKKDFKFGTYISIYVRIPCLIEFSFFWFFAASQHKVDNIFVLAFSSLQCDCNLSLELIGSKCDN
jgi:hypothetical protein